MTIKQSQTNNLNAISTDSDGANKSLKTGEHEWLDDNGAPDYHYLASLVESDNPQDFETLQGIADDLDIEYEADTPASELLDRIRMAERNE